MNKILRRVAAMATLASAFIPVTAHASDMYSGLSRTTPGEAYMKFSNGVTVENSNSPLAMKIYGGIALSDRYSVELGYGIFGDYKIVDPTRGSTERYSVSTKLVYVAGKASVPLGESFSVFGKVGIAANKFSTKQNSLPAGSQSFVRPMVGFGADYAITKRISGVLEYNFYGSSGNRKQQKMELGVKYAF